MAAGERLIRPRRVSSTMKVGAPTSAVMTPTGSCSGSTRVRASVSAASRKAAPVRALAGSSRRWSLPSSRRSACGTTRPTKPTEPATVTAVAAAEAHR
jgi:hypothetical protein